MYDDFSDYGLIAGQVFLLLVVVGLGIVAWLTPTPKTYTVLEVSVADESYSVSYYDDDNQIETIQVPLDTSISFKKESFIPSVVVYGESYSLVLPYSMANELLLSESNADKAQKAAV